MSSSTKGTLYLTPVPIADDSEWSLSPEIIQLLKRSPHILCERIRTSRRHIKSYLSQEAFDKIEFFELDKHKSNETPKNILDALEKGQDVLLMSEAGCPCIADPGYLLVQAAHGKNIRIHPIVGPSSVLLALMASGLQAQFFEFHGYLPRNQSDLARKIRYIEQQVMKYKRTQIFMETPYRNARLYDQLMKSSNGSLLLCIAKNINSPYENIKTASIRNWQKGSHPFIEKEPAIFIIGAH
jgi:16S rRNA (cytidine1402-2'-O)-methyltransferase